jgi:drug/metabolite transporter (DMT)-like permease
MGGTTPVMGAGASMLMGSAGLLALAVVLGQTAGFHLRDVSARSVLALGYLSVFGAVLGFTAYFWLVRHTTPASATTCAYVTRSSPCCSAGRSRASRSRRAWCFRRRSSSAAS